MTSAMDDARRSAASPRPKRPAGRAVARGGLTLGVVGAGLASPVRLAPWPEVVTDLSVAIVTVALTLLVFRAAFRFAARLRRVATRARLDLDTGRRPAITESWLHVVSGADAARVSQAVVAVAAELLEDGGRVLVLDAGRRLDLHAIFGRQPRWGVGECLAGTLPVLGLVQDTGCPGLYLLAQGAAARAEDWPRLGRVLDESAPHFSHAILALDALAPRAAGDALTGRRLEGWWAGAGPLSKTALALSERLAMPLSPLLLNADVESALEGLRTRPIAARGVLESAPPPAALAPLGLAPFAAAPETQAVLDWDQRVRERLRFLVWMRRLQSEHAQQTPARAS